jgi:hypothetical protein
VNPGPLYNPIMADPLEDHDREARAAARKSWPIRVFSLGEEPGDDLSGSTTAAERLDMVWPLTVDAWASAGLPIPDYPRSEAPIRVIRATGHHRKGGRA